MKTHLLAYLFTGLAFLAADGLWLGLIAKDFYRGQLGELMSPNPSIVAATAFYLLFVAGLVYFATAPALASGAWTTAFVNGAILGFVDYATYDVTNLAVIRGFPTTLAIADLVWGTVLSAVAATAGFFATRAISG